MTYLLIAVVIATAGTGGGPAPVVAEFNTKEACVAAAAEIARQNQKAYRMHAIPVLFCTPKGKP